MSRSGILSDALTRNAVPFSRPGTPGSRPEPKIGFIGLGNLGYIMAKNLATWRAEHAPNAPPLMIWNRTVSKAEALSAEVGVNKVVIAQTVQQIAMECEVVITNLANDSAVKDVYMQIHESLIESPPSDSKVFVDTSTIYPGLAGELDSLISSHQHAHLITAPVFGNPKAAATSQLVIVMSGDYYMGKKQVAYLLVPSVGRKVVDLGGNLEKAPTFKLIGNSMILGIIEVLAESFTFADKVGIDSETVHTFIQEMFPAPGVVGYSERLAHDRFDAANGFAIDGGIKDASLIRRLTSEHNSPMPTIDIAYQHLLTARAMKNAGPTEGQSTIQNLDWSALVAGPRVAAGLHPFDSTKHPNLVVEEAD